MASVQTWHLSGTPPQGLSTLPAGFLGAWGQTGTLAGASARRLDIGLYQLQTQVTPTWASSGSASLGHVQYLSGPLQAQNIASGNWLVAFAASVSNGTSWQGYAALYLVNGSTGAIRSTIFALGSIGASGKAVNGSELTVYSASKAGNAVTAQDGDYLALEIGVNWTGAGAPVSSVYDSGYTTIAADNAGASSAASRLVPPNDIYVREVAVRNVSPVAPVSNAGRSYHWDRAIGNMPADPRNLISNKVNRGLEG